MLYLCSVVLLLLSVFFFLYVVQIKLLLFSGADPGFFLGGGALVSSNKPHSFFCRIPVVLENRRSFQGGGVRTPCTLPLDPPPLLQKLQFLPLSEAAGITHSCVDSAGEGRGALYSHVFFC